MKKLQVIMGIALAILTIIIGNHLLEKNLMFRLMIGFVIGYALVRGSFGFAGSVNRPCRFGSTKLIRALMFLFVISAIGTAVLLFSGYQVNVGPKPINLGLILGAFSFGIGMALASCCASGVFQNLSDGSIRFLLVLLFFCVGVFFAQPLAKYSFVAEGKGISLLDWFEGEYNMFGALLITIVFALVVTYLAILIEQILKKKGKCQELPQENQYKEHVGEELPLNPITKKTYDIVLGNPWSLKTAAAVIAGAFITLMIYTKGTWGVSGVLGVWFAKILDLIGISTKWLTEYSGYTAEGINKVFSTNPTSIQNTGIFLGALIAVLTMARFKFRWRISLVQAGVYALGGLLLGLGITLGKGCNAGGLYSPIATFQLSGWVYLVFMVLGGIIGNILLKKVFKLNE